MYELLQKEFIESEATLRHLESQEFKDFVKDFRYVMKNIQRTLNQTNNYIKEVVSISKRGFEDAKADREMAAYYTKQHRDWEKFMHFRDKGYN
jgi:DNA-binding ferritin-like protein